MKEITYNEVPAVLAEIREKIDLLLEGRSAEREPEDRLMPVAELQTHIEKRTGRPIARQTIYDGVYRGTLPNEKHGKYLYFRRSVIDQWLNNGRRMPEKQMV